MPPITVHEIGPDGQLVQTTLGDEAPVAAAPAPAQEISGTPPDSAPAAAPATTPAAPAPAEEISGTPDSAPDVSTSPEPTEDEDDEAPEPLSRNAQRRIDRERRRRTEAEKKQAALEERVRMYEQGYQRPPPAPEAPPPPASLDRAAYATDDEWLEARDARLLAQAREQFHLEQLRQRHVQEQQARDAQWATREQTFKQQHPDYETRLQEVLPRLSPQLRQGLGDSEMAPDLVYHLAHHPDELQRLNGLQPLTLSRALGRLEQQLTAPSRPPSPPSQPKPAPPTPLNGAGSPGPRLLTDLSDAEIERLSLAEYDVLYKRQFGRVR